MSKNIVIFSDGTGQEGGRRFNTNVYKMFNMVEDRTPRQIAFYDRGIGTGRILAANLVALGTGRGFSRNVRDCYQFIFERYESGDRLFLIGFSRGAATVRALSYFIHLFGILPHSRPELIPQAWSIYRIQDREKREQRAKEFIARHHTIWTRVHFLGCYDTVAALGLPWRAASITLDRIPLYRHRFYSFDLSESVEHARHALAIDDARLTFHPVLWDTEVRDYQTLKQVWFAGAHTDIGGGYAVQQLSDIPLVWMTREAVEQGLRIYPRHKVRIDERHDGTLHDPHEGSWQRFYRRAVRGWPAETHGPPCIHESVERRVGHEGYAPWILEGRKIGRDCAVEPWLRHEELPLATRAEPAPPESVFVGQIGGVSLAANAADSVPDAPAG
jgi:uncharacterized protein (DUF2235 family)